MVVSGGIIWGHELAHVQEPEERSYPLMQLTI